MKLAVSNVAWYPRRVGGFMGLLKSLGCPGIELAASMIWEEPVESTQSERKELRDRIGDSGLTLTGLQALLYTRQDLALFSGEESRRLALEYLARLMDLCRDLGGRILVFGSPRNRRYEDMSPEKARGIGIDFFRRVGKEAADRGVLFCIEPLGRTETNFINTVAEAEGFIRDAGDPPGLGLHIDVKGLIDEGEVEAPYLKDCFSRARHVHVNDPGLKAPGSTGYDHGKIGEIVRASGYPGFVSIEMKRDETDAEGAVRRAVEYVRRAYFQAP